MNPYFVGEPAFVTDPHWRLQAPTGQLSLCREVARETKEPNEIGERLVDEHVAVVTALLQMNIPFKVAISHESLCHPKALHTYGRVNLLTGLPPEYPPRLTLFPRDLCTMLNGKATLLSPSMQIVTEKPRLYSSPFGEGGRILTAGTAAFVTERVIEGDGRSRPVDLGETALLKQWGYKVEHIPCPLFEDEKGLNSNDHLDRVSCLIRDSTDRLHYIVARGTRVAVYERLGITPSYLDTAMSLALIRERCATVGVRLHVVGTRVPCSLNLIQFPDRRVLMTSSDEEPRALIESLVGRECVTTTKVPIRYYPTWLYGGIRCLVSEAPLALLKRPA